MISKYCGVSDMKVERSVAGVSTKTGSARRLRDRDNEAA
jgi:hypothetical protein